MSNAVFDVVRTVLAVREFQDKPIPDDVLGRIVEAAHLLREREQPPAVALCAGHRTGRSQGAGQTRCTRSVHRRRGRRCRRGV